MATHAKEDEAGVGVTSEEINQSRVMSAHEVVISVEELMKHRDRLERELVHVDALAVAFHQALLHDYSSFRYIIWDSYQARANQLAQRLIDIEKELISREVEPEPPTCNRSGGHDWKPEKGLKSLFCLNCGYVRKRVTST